ncbi:Rpp14/Pop5 family-domain-containing protein [Pyrenochaeta sp. MPI-SDFR-AT-0127]|nr:Rpp14/Pop5 family-domain-containing protein [Pyrenochaeta sp. MPI-SDFR-AT-0127]
MVRVKFRYLVVNFLYPEPTAKSKTPLPGLVQIHSPTPDAFHPGLLVRMIRNEVEELYGDYGMGMVSAGLKVNYYSPSTSTAIIRCPRDHYEMVWAALTYITHLPKPIDIPVVMRVVRVSGTIRKAEEEVIRRSQQIIKRAKAWEGSGGMPMLQSIEKAVDKERKRESEVLARVDNDAESDEMSE